MSILTLFGCKTKEEIYLNKHKVIFANTKEFDAYINTAIIKPIDAKKLMLDYVNNNSLQPESSLFFIIDDYYTFTNYFHPKIPEAYTGKIWISSKTGEVKLMPDGLYLRAYYSYKW